MAPRTPTVTRPPSRNPRQRRPDRAISRKNNTECRPAGRPVPAARKNSQKQPCGHQKWVCRPSEQENIAENHPPPRPPRGSDARHRSAPTPRGDLFGHWEDKVFYMIGQIRWWRGGGGGRGKRHTERHTVVFILAAAGIPAAAFFFPPPLTTASDRHQIDCGAALCD